MKIVTILLLLCVLGFSYADMAPSYPTINLHVKLDGSDIKETFYAVGMICAGPAPKNETGLETEKNQILSKYPDTIKYIGAPLWTSCAGTGRVYPLGPPPRGGECKNSTCSFDSLSPFETSIVFYIPSLNKTFVGEAMLSQYSDWYVNINSNGSVSVTTTQPGSEWYNYWISMLLSLIATIIIELITSFGYLHFKKLDKKILLSLIVVNIISLPLLWIFINAFVYINPRWQYSNSFFGFGPFSILFISELIVFAFEGVGIYLLNKNRISLNQALQMSLINNVASFISGFILLAGLLSMFQHL